MAVQPQRRRPHWMRHATGYAYVFFLCCLFTAIVLWNNRNMEDEPGKPAAARAESVFKDTQSALHGSGTHSKEEGAGSIASTASTASTATTVESANAYPFNPEDALIMFKTGASMMWHRVPMHLSTTFANKTLTPHVVFYSDMDAEIGGYPVIDSLANVSAKLKGSPDFEYWHLLRQAHADNLYTDNEDPNAPPLVGGWRIDKYKFVPLVAHAAKNWPDKKWYIYIEDDTFYFWESLYAWLASFDWRESVFVGGPAGRLGEDFAHGGSGFALSHGAMKKSFLADPKLADRWDDYSLEQGCGDHILSHVLASKGVTRWHGFDSTDKMPLQSLPLLQLPIGDWNWCSPLFNLHKVHQQDISTLHAWEQEFKATRGGTVRYRDVFLDFVAPRLVEEHDEWENYSDSEHYSSNMEPDGGQKLSDAEKRKKPWFNAEACKQACREKQLCLQWKYADDNCYHSHVVKPGHHARYGIRMKSGWMLDRIKKLEKKTCGPLPWPEPR